MKAFKIFLLFFTVPSFGVFAQVQINNGTSAGITGSNVLIDGSTSFSNESGAGPYVGKGVIIPSVDLVNFEFDLTLADGSTFPTFFDGMVVYNKATGVTLTIGDRSSTAVSVSPGFYYFSNPNGFLNGNVTSGIWKPIGASLNIYNSDDKFTSNRTANLDGKTLSFTNTTGTAVVNQFSVDGSTFSVDAANDRVGIGTAAPGTSLDVVGTTRSTLNFGNAHATNFRANSTGTAQGQLTGMSFYPTFVGTADNGPRRAADIWSGFNGGAWGSEFLAFGVAGATDVGNVTTERMRITATGNVGIGTTAPGSKLEVLEVNANYTTPTTLLTLTRRATNNTLNINDGTGARISFRAQDKDFNSPEIAYIDALLIDPDYNGIGRSGDLVFSTLRNWNGSNLPLERMRILSNGNVGIGTSTPAQALHVVGTERVSTLVAATSTAAYAAAGNAVVFSNANGDMVTSKATANATELGYFLKGDGTWSAPTGASTVSVTDNNTSASTVYPGWFTGAGTVAPFISTTQINFVPSTGKLTTAGDVQAGAYATLTTGGVAGYFQDITNGAFRARVNSATTNGYYFQTNAGATTTMYVGLGGTYNGHVGINNTTPNGELQFSNTTVNRKIVLWEGANNDHQFFGFGVNAGTFRYQVNSTGDSHIFYGGASATTSTEFMRVTGIGVGIGTNAAPTAMLDIVKANALATTQDMFRTAYDGNWGMRLVQNYAGAGDIKYELKQKYNATEYDVLAFKAGNVGVGTTSPTAKLHVAGTVRIVDGTEAVDRVLRSDNSGNASWVNLASVASSAGTSIVTKTAAYTATTTDYTILCNTTTAGFTLTLPASPAVGKQLLIRKVDEGTNVLTISPALKLSATTNISTVNYVTSLWVQWDGTNWWVIR